MSVPSASLRCLLHHRKDLMAAFLKVFQYPLFDHVIGNVESVNHVQEGEITPQQHYRICYFVLSWVIERITEIENLEVGPLSTS